MTAMKKSFQFSGLEIAKLSNAARAAIICVTVCVSRRIH